MVSLTDADLSYSRDDCIPHGPTPTPHWMILCPSQRKKLSMVIGVAATCV